MRASPTRLVLLFSIIVRNICEAWELQELQEKDPKVVGNEALPLCYNNTSNYLDFVPLELSRELAWTTAYLTDKRVQEVHAKEVKDVDSESIRYGNLKCPWEMAKYSCFHQGSNVKATLSYLLSQQEDSGGTCRLPQFDAAAVMQLLGTRKLLFLGDSLARQQFISFVCLMHRHPSITVVKDGVNWYADWPCHGTKNCIKGGQHSGFAGGCVVFGSKDNADVKLTVCTTDWKKGNLDDVHGYSVGLIPGHSILIANIGIHSAAQYRGAQLKLFLAYYEKNRKELPIVIYRQTSPQHFKTPGGEFQPGLTGACLPSLPKLESAGAALAGNAFAIEEMNLVKGRLPFLAVNPLSADAGTMHIASGVEGATGRGIDCTHWALAGVPDIWNRALVSYLSAHLRTLEVQAP